MEESDLLFLQSSTIVRAKFSKTLSLAVSYENFQKFSFFSTLFFTLSSLTDTNSVVNQKYVLFALLNYSSLSYTVLALSSAIINLPNKTFNFP